MSWPPTARAGRTAAREGARLRAGLQAAAENVRGAAFLAGGEQFAEVATIVATDVAQHERGAESVDARSHSDGMSLSLD
nr:hypothetical protein Ade03nite_78260 [Actinoplanes derwentensis]